MSDLRDMFAHLSFFDDGGIFAELEVKSTWVLEIKDKQSLDGTITPQFKQVKDGSTKDFGINSDGIFCFRWRYCVPNDHNLRQSTLQKAHSSSYVMHPGSIKMYQDLREVYWWPDPKREVTEFISKCLTCRQVKTKPQYPSGLLQPIQIPR
ncbi:uncharacterized protein LOC128039926 [Gossypium raimondii]|uniref:uncharacterized protein LOC128039926 n=1 Tax=Gossypium raimondii TaxID=29730 RepID=UPI00227B73B2|nr:uncharacterized protein LOC128039926 [Gossypium raimondii]